MNNFFNKLPTSSGFTLLEVMIASAIIGTIAAIAAPNWTNFVNQQRLKEANEQMDAALRLAQARARQESQSYSVQFRSNSGIPQIVTFRGSTLPSGSPWVNLHNQANLITMSLTQGDRVTFNMDGSIADNSPLRANEKVTLSLTGVPNIRRECVMFRTLLGSMERGSRDSDCDQS
jgi:prepilin-type N-terminal cleavage/methylation domain-containing protein